MAGAALQQTPITFRSRGLPAISHLSRRPPGKLCLSSNLRIPKLTVKPLARRVRGRGARMADTAAGSYATALADVASSNNTLDQTYGDVENLSKVLSDEDVVRFLSNPIIDDSEKRSIVGKIADSSDLQPHVVNFLNILLDMKRIDLFGEIAKEFEVLYNGLTRTELAVVTSVVQLESQQLAEIAKGVQQLTGAKNVRIKTAIDPSLVAGFTIRYGNSGSKLIDLSIKKQLEEIASQLEIGEIQLGL